MSKRKYHPNFETKNQLIEYVFANNIDYQLIATNLLPDDILTAELLDLSESRLNEDEVTVILEIIKHSDISSVTLNCCTLSEDSIKLIAEALANNLPINILKMIGNSIGDDGAEKIIGSLKDNNNLQVLDISVNNIQNLSGEICLRSLQNNSILRELNLSGNNLGKNYDNIVSFVNILADMPSLSSLLLGANNINNEALLAIISAMYDNHVLEKLDLGGNQINNSATEEIIKFLKSKWTLQNLYLGENHLDQKFLLSISSQIKANSEVIKKAALFALKLMEEKPDAVLSHIVYIPIRYCSRAQLKEFLSEKEISKLEDKYLSNQYWLDNALKIMGVCHKIVRKVEQSKKNDGDSANNNAPPKHLSDIGKLALANVISYLTPYDFLMPDTNYTIDAYIDMELIDLNDNF